VQGHVAPTTSWPQNFEKPPGFWYYNFPDTRAHPKGIIPLEKKAQFSGLPGSLIITSFVKIPKTLFQFNRINSPF